MIGPFIDIKGAIDVHVHSEPDLFPRIADDVGVARHAASLGLRALSLKCHSERTTSRAYLTRQLVPGIQIIGGIVLNRAVGGSTRRRWSRPSSSAPSTCGCPP